MHVIVARNVNCGGGAGSVARACAGGGPLVQIAFDLRENKVRITSAEGRKKFEAALATAGFRPNRSASRGPARSWKAPQAAQGG